MRSHRLRKGLVVAALVAMSAGCGPAGEVPPPEPANEEEADPVAPPSPAPDIDPAEEAIPPDEQ